MSDNTNILKFIHTICANSESGRLEILAGAIQGELSFAEGKLVDARFGHLTGFRAVNAIAAMQNARFSFDPAFAPIASGSITASERVVLKQFFGIETAATGEYLEPIGVNRPVEEAAPLATVPDEIEDITIVRNDVPSPVIPTPPPPPAAARFSYRTALALAVLVMAVMAAVAIFMTRSHSPASSSVVASAESPSRPAPVEEPVSPAAQSAPARSVPAPASVKESKKPLSYVRDLSGKWTVVNSIDTTTYGSFKNMKIGFDLSIDQTGSTFTGKGRKISENGRSLPANSRTPIHVQGSIKGDRIEATFIEDGTARKSNGRFVWRIDKSGRGLIGNFATTAARSRGKSSAIRL
ncbi:MAG TPA: DUF4388 domain-containing protein [Pyrinomonadaceae bacterium]|nr:DUF4388 domain-containing protein [Pyrinomonadaceae bacterium]